MKRPDAEVAYDPTAVFKEGHLDVAAAVADLGRPPEPSDFLRLADVVAANARNVNWWYGDLLNALAQMFGGEITAQFVDSRGLSSEYYSAIVRVSRAYPVEERFIPVDDPDPAKSVPGLSWTHHREALFLEDPQERRKLLREAMDRNWATRTVASEAKKRAAVEVSEVDAAPSAPSLSTSQTLTVTAKRSSAAALEALFRGEFLSWVKDRLVEAGIDVVSVSTVERNPNMDAHVEESPPPAKKATKKAAKPRVEPEPDDFAN